MIWSVGLCAVCLKRVQMPLECLNEIKAPESQDHPSFAIGASHHEPSD